MANEVYNYRQKNEKLLKDSAYMEYLEEKRGLTEDTIRKFSLGKLNQGGYGWVSIPLFNLLGEFVGGYKLRSLPWEESNSLRYLHYPNGIYVDCPFNAYNLNPGKDKVVICEGEFDCMLLNQYGYNAVTSVTGGGSFKDEYFDVLEPFQEIIILFDNDESGAKFSVKLAERLSLKFPSKLISIAKIPKEDEVKDITDYIVKYKNIHEVINKRKNYKGIDVTKFKEMGVEDIKADLDILIKHDDFTKVIGFLGVVSTYSPDFQLNICMMGPSSTGKTFIINAVTSLMPKEDLVALQYASPKAFFHEKGKYDKEENALIVNLDKKCLFFADQPGPAVLETLRPILSHDKKVLESKITDKDMRGGNSTKNVKIIGFPSVFFCTANLKMDEQETARLIMLSPEVTKEKIEEGVRNVFYPEKKENVDASMRNLKNRLLAIKYLQIKDVRFSDSQKLRSLRKMGKMKQNFIPKDMRDGKKVKALAYAMAMLNFNNRKVENGVLYAKDSDIEQAFILWDSISVTQSYDLPPYLLEVFERIYVSLYKEKGIDIEEDVYLEKSEISKKFAQVFGRALRQKEFKETIEAFESIDLIEIGNHALDGRKQTYKLSSEGKKYIMERCGGIENYG
jgi:5S rRNA maturation endonuclease (ribonuclease M5)